MRMNTFFQISIYLSIVLIIFTLSINFISTMNVFGTLDTGIEASGNTTSVFTKITGLSGGMNAVWLMITTGAGIVSLGLAIWMRSAVPVGAYLFSTIFWTSYIRSISVVNVTGIFNSEPLSSFLLIGTVGMLFIWAAALVGIFTGGG